MSGSSGSGIATGVTIVHEAELQAPRQSGGRIRAYCHLHGSNRQRSLSIAAYGEAAGYGYCHSCHATVFVPELNPEEAARRERGQTREPRRAITPAALLRPERPRPLAPQSAPAEWQRAELATLVGLAARMRARLADERPRAYLEARGIPYDVAADAGVGYIPAEAPARVRGAAIGKWRDRLVFPLGIPHDAAHAADAADAAHAGVGGVGYAGRSLWGWRPGMDENEHKQLLESTPHAPRRWEKSYPAGWLGYDALAAAEYAVLVEGPLDALALRASGLFDDVPVVALVGTAGRPEWIPPTVRGVVLALDYDKPEASKAADALARELTMAGIAVVPCAPPRDDKGKDWSERWRVASWDGVWPVAAAVDALTGYRPLAEEEPAGVAPEIAPGEDVTAEGATTADPVPAKDVTAAEDAGTGAPWLADPLVRCLLALGFELEEARELEPAPVPVS